MTDDEQREGNDPAEAFEDLRGEVALVRRAVERLSAERAEVPEPVDYSETLGIISQNLSGTAQRVDALVRSPALALTPETISRQIDAAGYTVRVEDHRLFAAAKQGLEEVTARLGRYLQSDIAVGEQRRRLRYASLIGLVLGMALWAAGAGVVARAMPETWLWPEKMAARTLRLDAWTASRRLAAVSQPDTWNKMVVGVIVVQENREAIERCRRAAAKARKAVPCTVSIAADQASAAPERS